MSKSIVEMRNVTKIFNGIVANDNICLQLREGEIHALLGENGAGKSTLMSILCGLYEPDDGEIFFDGQAVKIETPNVAYHLGIGMVHQHFKLVQNFTVLENIILGNETVSRGMVRLKEAREQVVNMCKEYRFDINPDMLIENLSVGMQQKVEILKMLYRKNKVLIFDEPTAVLTPGEIEEFLKMLKDLAANGCSILFITHKISEIMSVADRCTVIRKGRYVDTLDVDKTSAEELSEKMVGRKVDLGVVNKKHIVIEEAEPILTVSALTMRSEETKKPVVDDVSFVVNAGEIVCIAGIDGNGQSELVYGITGMEKIEAGEISVLGENVTEYTIRERIKAGIAHIPEDRHKHGLILEYPIDYNIALRDYDEEPFQKYGIMNYAKIRARANGLIDKYDVRSSEGSATVAGDMSGGNQQKVVIAREMAMKPRVVIAVQPTRGLDVGAIEFVHKELVDFRNNGNAVLLISKELDEVMKLADRILVMFEGEIVAQRRPDEVTIKELGMYMSGASTEGER